MPTAPLPAEPDLDQLRTQARELQRRVRAGDPDSCDEVAELHPAGDDPAARERFPLSAAQLVVAHRHGFASWPRLVAHVELVRSLTRRPADVPPATDPATELLRLACLHYDDDDDPERFDAARALAGRHPELATTDVGVAAAQARPAALAALLATDPDAARRELGPMRWPPLLYLAYSRALDASEDDVLQTARLLLDHGADPNAGYLWHGLPTPFTALTGCFGAGELGETLQPRHPHGHALARLLLTRGADANDGQTLYNRQFRTDDSHLRILFEHGLGRGDGGPWKRRLGPALDDPVSMVRGQLRWAVLHDMVDRVRLLADNDVDVVAPFPGGHTPLDLARLSGATATASLLASLGAESSLDPVGTYMGALLAGDRGTADRLVAAEPTLPEAARSQRRSLAVWAAARGRPDAVALVLDHGFDVDALGRGDIPSDQPWETALHTAAFDGDVGLVQLLLDRGADPTIHDARFDATPLGWARHAGQDEVARLLEPVTPTDEEAGGTG